MTKEKRKKQIALRVLIIAASAAVFCAAVMFIVTTRRMNIRDYFGIESESEVGITVDFTKPEKTGRVIEGSIYVDYETAAGYINPSVFYDEKAGVLITTTPHEKTVLEFEGGVTQGHEAGFLDDILYISLDYLTSVTDLVSDVYEEPAYVHIGRQESYETASFLRDTPVRVLPGNTEKIIAEGISGTTVVMDPSFENRSWARIITETGLPGYVKSSCISGSGTVLSGIGQNPDLVYTRNHPFENVTMVFHQTDNKLTNDAIGGMLEGVTGVNVIAPTWFYLDSEDGAVRDVTDPAYVETVHQEGMQVWAVLNDFDGSLSSVSGTAAFLESYEARAGAAEAVLDSLKACGADGLSVDFEYVRAESAGNFLQFIRELSVLMRNENLVLSVENYVPTYTAYMDREEQARVADYIVVMCYDEHTSGSKEAGSVASLSFVKKGIEDTLKEVSSSQLIAALPFFTRLWTTVDGSDPESMALGMQKAQETLSDFGMTAEWDEKTGQNYAEIREGDTLRQIWFEDGDSVAAKMSAVREAGCAGSAWWKLGLETDDIWAVIEEGAV